jgi:hypothetical protein
LIGKEGKAKSFYWTLFITTVLHCHVVTYIRNGSEDNNMKNKLWKKLVIAVEQTKLIPCSDRIAVGGDGTICE